MLTGSTTAADKRDIRQGLADGSIQFVVGTHALLQENVIFKALGLVVTDEQHRFGVSQRACLAGKGINPHLLVMSATPIPRTLALIIYGDLDISVLDELPPGRQIIETYRIDSGKRQRAYNFIKKHLDMGRQAYIVCPLVEQNQSELTAATVSVSYTHLVLPYTVRQLSLTLNIRYSFPSLHYIFYFVVVNYISFDISCQV